MKVNYPNPHVHDSSSSSMKTKARGMLFENELNKSNEYYLNQDKAVIYKKPTPVRIVKVEYPSRSHAKIVEAYYQIPSTTDYNGIYRGKYIDYEAKETESLSFPFRNIFPHQVEHLLRIDKQGGIAFVIIYFHKIDKVFMIDIKDFYKPYKDQDKLNKHSIKYSEIESLGGLEVSRGYCPLVDYLKQVDEKYFK